MSGFGFLDLLAKQQSKSFESVSRFQAQMFSADWFGVKVLFLKPMTYMNNSGRSVGAVARYYKISPENILVVHDDLDFDAGLIRLKKNGGHGGHNGVRDVIKVLGSKSFRATADRHRSSNGPAARFKLCIVAPLVIRKESDNLGVAVSRRPMRANNIW